MFRRGRATLACGLPIGRNPIRYGLRFFEGALAQAAMEEVAQGDLPIARLHHQRKVDHLGMFAVLAPHLEQRKPAGAGLKLKPRYPLVQRCSGFIWCG